MQEKTGCARTFFWSFSCRRHDTTWCTDEEVLPKVALMSCMSRCMACTSRCRARRAPSTSCVLAAGQRDQHARNGKGGEPRKSKLS